MYIQVENNNLTAYGAYPFEGYTKEVPLINYESYVAHPERYIFKDGDITVNPNWEEEEKQREKERVARLTCTKRDFVLMLQESGISYKNTLKPLIDANEQASIEWELCERLHRFNPLLDQMAGSLGITPEQLDTMFKRANGEEV